MYYLFLPISLLLPLRIEKRIRYTCCGCIILNKARTYRGLPRFFFESSKIQTIASYVTSFILLRVTPPDPADPAPFLKQYPASLPYRPIIDLRRYQVYEKENTETQVQKL
jgi:hypothetical protein